MHWTQSPIYKDVVARNVKAMRDSVKGKPFSDDHKRKLSESIKASYRKKIADGYVNPRRYKRNREELLASSHLVRQYRCLSRKRGFGDLSMTKDQFLDLISKNCSYCGSPPRERVVIISHYGIRVIANGVDRIDNAKPYSAENCVPCCRTCNLMKNKMSLADFKDHVRRVADHLCL
jgi:5-methylcytosine-specific restriction endonuclease McrA